MNKSSLFPTATAILHILSFPLKTQQRYPTPMKNCIPDYDLCNTFGAKTHTVLYHTEFRSKRMNVIVTMHISCVAYSVHRAPVSVHLIRFHFVGNSKLYQKCHLWY